MDLLELKKKYYKYTTNSESLEAVKRNGYSLRYVKEQTEQICLEAVKQESDSLKYVKEECIKLEYTEMTIEQVCEELGKNIKLIK